MRYELRAYAVAEQLLPGWACIFGANDTSFHRIVFHVWVAQGGGRTALIDAGPPPGDDDFRTLCEACAGMGPQCGLRRLRTLESVLAEAGLSPQAIDAVLITQPITYHTGGLVPRLFPRAKVYLPRQGLLEFLLDNPGHPPRNCYFTSETWDFLHRLLLEDRLALPEGRVETLEDLWLEVTGGHHPGSAAANMPTARGRVAILETAFLAENIEQERPVGIAEDVAQCRRVIREYRRSCDLVLAAHDGTLLERFPQGVIA